MEVNDLITIAIILFITVMTCMVMTIVDYILDVTKGNMIWILGTAILIEALIALVLFLWR